MSNKKKDRSVGYKNPPKDHQFKPGQSGNPKGRPKKPQTFTDALKLELETEIPVTEHGKTHHIPIVQALVKTVTHGALKGDNTKLKMLWGAISQMKSPPPGFDALPEDDEILKQFLDQLGDKNGEQDDENH